MYPATVPIDNCFLKCDGAKNLPKVIMSPLPDFLADLRPGKPTQIYRLEHNLADPVFSMEAAVDLNFRPQSLNPEAAIATGKDSVGIKRYDLALFDQIGELSLDNASAVAYSQNGLMLAAGNNKGLVRVWSLESKVPDEICELQIGRRCISSLMFDSSGKRLFIINTQGDAYLTLIEQDSLPSPVLLDQAGEAALEWDFFCMDADTKNQRSAFGGYGKDVYVIDYGKPDEHGAPKVVLLQTADGPDTGRATSHLHFLGKELGLGLICNEGLQIWDLADPKLTHVWRAPSGCRIANLKQYETRIWIPLLTDSNR